MAERLCQSQALLDQRASAGVVAFQPGDDAKSRDALDIRHSEAIRPSQCHRFLEAPSRLGQIVLRDG